MVSQPLAPEMNSANDARTLRLLCGPSNLQFERKTLLPVADNAAVAAPSVHLAIVSFLAGTCSLPRRCSVVRAGSRGLQ
jgi:hypothetical protein